MGDTSRLLQWAIANTTAEDLQAHSQTSGSLDPAWLDAICPDEVKQMQVLLARIEAPNATTEHISVALEDLLYLVEDLNNAENFHVVGGLSVVLPLLSHEESEVRESALWVLGTSLQLNPKGQAAFIAQPDAVAAVTNILFEPDKESDVAVRQKALLTLSAFLRQHPEGQKMFGSELDGWPKLVGLLSDDNEKIVQRTLFLLKMLIGVSGSELCEDLSSAGVVAAALPHVSSSTEAVQLNALGTLEACAAHEPLLKDLNESGAADVLAQLSGSGDVSEEVGVAVASCVAAVGGN